MFFNKLTRPRNHLARALQSDVQQTQPSSVQTLIEQAADSIPRYPRRAFLEALTDTPSPSLISQARSSLQKRFPFLPFDSSVRRQQLTEMLSAEEKQRMIEANRERDQAIVIAFISFGFATAGQLLFWPLGLLSIPGILYVPRPIYQRTYNLLKQGKVGVPTLFTLTALGCIVSGYFWVASFGLLIVSLAFKYILQVTEETRYNLINVFQATPKFVWVLIDDQEIKTPIEEIAIGDVIVVHAGEAIPVDGSVISGMATVDQKFLTGEARPAEKESGDPVFASTVLLSGRISISVEKAGHDTTVARIGRVLNDTIDYKSSVQLRANTLADKTVLPTMVVSALALPLLGPMGALALMDSHFRYKLSFVVPLSLMNFLNIASQQGILIKDGRSLDLLSQVDTIVFDKTGTLTDEQPHIHAIHTYGAYHEDQVLTYAAAAEYRQTHPIAQAILEAAGQRNLTLPQIEDSAYKIGYGLTVHLASNLVQVGSYRFMEATDVSIPAELTQTQTACHELGHSLVLVAVDGAVVGAIELAPTIRPEARAIIQNLKQRPNIQSISIISGDQETPTRKLAQELGIDQYFAEILPEGKADIIQQLIDEGRFVCYVGDGINDSIALRKSHVSISLRGASTVATDTAQIIMMHGNLAGLPTVFDYAHDFYINTNVAFGLVLLPMFIGAGGVVFLGFGLFHTTILGVSGLMLGLGNSMVPAIKYRKLVHQPGTGHDTIVTEADADTIRALLAQT